MKYWCLTFCLVIAALFGSVGVGLADQCVKSPRACSDVALCIYATTKKYSHYKTDTFWTADQQLFEYVREAKRRGLTCRVGQDKSGSGIKSAKKKPTALKMAFIQLTADQRKQLQSNLKDLNFYKSSIDGLYGKGTSGALKAYNKEHLGSADLKKSANAEKLINTVLALKPVAKPIAPASPAQPKDTYKVASGTGFYVSDQGHIITNHHVIDGCKNMKVHSKGKVLETLKIAYDELNDLALLKISGKPTHVFALSNESAFPLQDIVVAGFPFGDEISSSLKFTRGIVSSLTGIGNNYSEIQIDAAIQPGNSGGPIMDEFGNIVGVAVAKLDIKAIIEDYGVIPENTNFGVKSSAVRNLMEGNGIPFKSPNTEMISRRELSQIATDGTVFLTCWMTMAQIEKMQSEKVMFSNLK